MEILKVSSRNFQKVVNKIEKFLKEGKVVVCPTDTVYGILCDATNKKAVERLFKIKKRSENKPVPIFIKDISAAKKLAEINKKQEAFLKSVWFTRPNFCDDSRKKEKLVEIAPKIWAGKGKVTVVLKRKKIKKRIYGINKKTIALRIPNYQLINDLLRKIKKPLTGTSANISNKSVSTKIKEVIKQFQNQKLQPDLVIDAGNLKSAKPSKVIDLTSSKPKILRK